MLTTFFTFSFIFIFGCCIGSFLNVLIDRIPRGESVMKGRSHCDSCHHVLAWLDLIPFLSFVFLQGKCRYCKKGIGLQTFAVEVFTGILFVITYYFFIITSLASDSYFFLSLLYTLYIFSTFIVVAVIDIKHGIIPNNFVYPAMIIALIFHLLTLSTVLPYIVSGLGACFFFFTLFVITKGRGMGFGDVKLALLLGLFLGYPNIIIGLYVAFLTGAVIALILVLRKKKSFSQGTIPFGPFLIGGAMIAFFYGDTIWNMFLHKFF